ncbi:hypothetical protein HY251_07305, partial [bacterium]|nr:hypothetical protein [bacterium]
GHAPRECALCGSRFHVDCVRSHGKCPTLGCAGEIDRSDDGRVHARGRKSPLLALALSFFAPGIGHVYAGELMRAAGILLSAPLLVALVAMLLEELLVSSGMSAAARDRAETMVLQGTLVAFLLFWLFQVVDAYCAAQRANQRGARPISERPRLSGRKA